MYAHIAHVWQGIPFPIVTDTLKINTFKCTKTDPEITAKHRVLHNTEASVPLALRHDWEELVNIYHNQRRSDITKESKRQHLVYSDLEKLSISRD